MEFEVILIFLVAIFASFLTLISGFGLGTLLLPAFILVFDPLEAVAMTAVVHFANNVFKMGLLYKKVDRFVLLWFGVSGIVGAFIGAQLSVNITHSVAYSSLYEGGNDVTWFAFVVGVLMILFALQELFIGKRGFQFSKRALLPGGAISGFFGGLTGHQGALRSMFLLKSGLSTEAYIATGVGIALLVDITRIPIYLERMQNADLSSDWYVMLGAVVSAFIGAVIGKRLMKKVTYSVVQWIVGLLLIAIGIALILGVL